MLLILAARCKIVIDNVAGKVIFTIDEMVTLLKERSWFFERAGDSVRESAGVDVPSAAHPECHVLFVLGAYIAALQPANISIQQPMHLFAESVCWDEAVLDLRFGTMKRLMAHWVLHACTEVEKTRAS